MRIDHYYKFTAKCSGLENPSKLDEISSKSFVTYFFSEPR